MEDIGKNVIIKGGEEVTLFALMRTVDPFEEFAWVFRKGGDKPETILQQDVIGFAKVAA